MAGDNDAGAVLVESRILLDIVDEEVKSQLPVHSLIDKNRVLLDKRDQMLVEDLKQHGSRVLPALVFLNRVLKAVSKRKIAVDGPIVHVSMLSFGDLLEGHRGIRRQCRKVISRYLLYLTERLCFVCLRIRHLDNPVFLELREEEV